MQLSLLLLQLFPQKVIVGEESQPQEVVFVLKSFLILNESRHVVV